jgi:hypothetical protein
MKARNLKLFLIIFVISMTTFGLNILIDSNLLTVYDLTEDVLTIDDKSTIVDKIRKYCPLQNIKISSQCKSVLETVKTTNHSKFDAKYNNDCSICPTDRIIQYHTYWRMDIDKDLSNSFHRMMNLNIMSYLYSQNLCCTIFNLWISDTSFSQERITKLVIKYRYFIDRDIFKIKKLNLIELCNGTIFENHQVCQQKVYLNKKQDTVAYSDFIRFLLLNKYNGMWFDGDLIFLKDLQPLWHYNFMYQWANRNYYNTAISNCWNFTTFKPLIESLMEKHTSAINFINSLPGKSLTSMIAHLNNNKIYKYKNLIIFHSYLFDPIWIQTDTGIHMRELDREFNGFTYFKQRVNLKEKEFDPNMFFNLSFTYHLHSNNFHDKISNKSYFSYFENFYNKHFDKVFYATPTTLSKF